MKKKTTRSRFPIPAFDRAAAACLLTEDDDDPCPSADIAAKAHRLLKLKQHGNAGLLFCLAAERAKESAQAGQSALYALQAAITLSKAGFTLAAEPALKSATIFDWANAGLPDGNDLIEAAFTRLLLNAATQEPASFTGLFQQAIERCHEVGIEFPGGCIHQEALLTTALALRDWDAAAHIIQLIAECPSPDAI